MTISGRLVSPRKNGLRQSLGLDAKNPTPNFRFGRKPRSNGETGVATTAQRRKISPQTAFSDWIPTGTGPPAPIWPSKHLKAHFPESRFRADNQGIQSKNAAAGAGCDLGNWRGTGLRPLFMASGRRFGSESRWRGTVGTLTVRSRRPTGFESRSGPDGND